MYFLMLAVCCKVYGCVLMPEFDKPPPTET
jgi:hypothetical protein